MNKVEQIFVAKRQYQGLLNTKLNHADNFTSVNMQQIVNYILSPQQVSNRDVLSQINSSVHRRRLYKKALNHISDMQSMPQVAASSIDVNMRSAEGFEIKWVFDKSIDKQVFVIVKLSNGVNTELEPEKTINGLFVHAEFADKFHLIYFDHTESNKYQLLTTQDSEIFSLIRNPESHLYIVSS